MTQLIRPFDPWKSPLCTCREKYSLNPYTGCAHGCLYCYSTYIPDFYKLRLKKRLEQRVEIDLKKIPEKSLISISNSSDPYPPVERKLEKTRNILRLLRDYNMRIMIVTKSDMVCRDVDLLDKGAVSISIITLRDEVASLIEPGAPNPEKRIKALQRLKESGIPVILRLDPILPGLTEGEVEKIIEKCSFADHIVSSTLKLRYDSFKRLKNISGEVYRRLYFIEGEKIRNSFYMPTEIRRNILDKVKKICEEFGLSYAFCREGFNFRAESCDGSHLIP
jgi:DNA repair photolyase